MMCLLNDKERRMWRSIKAEFYWQIGHWVEKMFGHWDFGGYLYQRWMRHHFELSTPHKDACQICGRVHDRRDPHDV